MSWQGVYMIFLACRKGNVADLHSPGSEIYKRNRLAWLQCSVGIEFVHWQSPKIIFQSISITKIFDKLVDSCHILSWVVLSLGKIKSVYEGREQCFFVSFSPFLCDLTMCDILEQHSMFLDWFYNVTIILLSKFNNIFILWYLKFHNL